MNAKDAVLAISVRSKLTILTRMLVDETQNKEVAFLYMLRFFGETKTLKTFKHSAPTATGLSGTKIKSMRCIANMLKRLLFLAFLLPIGTYAQNGTQHDRIRSRGQSTFDSIANTATVVITGSTPSISGGNIFKTNNGGVTTVTNFLGGVDSQQITVICGDANTTIQNNTHIVTASAADFVCGVNQSIAFIFDAAQGKWVQSGSVSGGGGGGGSPGAPANCLQKNNGASGFACSGESSDGTTFKITEDVQQAGPNPSFDIRAFGGYNGADAGTTGSITSGSPVLTLAAARDFANGHGIVVNKAGALTSLATPPQATVTPSGILNGVTTYNYRIIAEDRKGGLTAASVVGTTTTGAATLGRNTITLTSCVMTDGTVNGVLGGSVATYTSSGNHNLQAGAQIDIEGFTGAFFDGCNGVVRIVTTPTATTFTVTKGLMAAETNTTGSPTAAVQACNELTYPDGSVTAGYGVTLRYWIYRNNVLVGVAQGLDPYFNDCGVTAPTAPSYIPSAPPSSPQAGYLSTTILSGGGTTSLTLAASASTTASSQAVIHDNSPALRQAIQAAYNFNGGTAYIPNGGVFNFNSSLDMTTGFTNVFSSAVKIRINNDSVSLNQPWILRSALDIECDPHRTTSFQYVNGCTVGGNAYPLFYALEGQASGVHLKLLRLFPSQPQQSGLYTDEGGDGGSTVGWVLDDVTAGGSNGVSKPLIIKGGFDFIWNRGVCDPGGSVLPVGSCLTFARSSRAVTGALSNNAGQITYRVQLDKVFFTGSAIQFDCRGNSVGAFSHDFTFNKSLYESVVTPYVDYVGCGGGSQLSRLTIHDLDIADNVSGISTPVVDGTTGGPTDVHFIGGSGNAGPLVVCLVGNTGCSVSGEGAGTPGGFSNSPAFNSGNLNYATSVNFFGSAGIGGVFSGRVFYPLPTLAAPVLTPSAGGSVPVGAHIYQAASVDIDGFETLLGPKTSITVAGGTQTVTVAHPTLPSGATGWRPFRDGFRANIQAFGSCATAVIPATTDFVDTFSFTCGNSAVNVSYTGQSVLGPNGISTPSFRLMNSGFTTTITGDGAANRSVTYPAASGTVCLTAACTVNSVTIGGDGALSANPRSTPPVFFPGALTTTWTGASWTPDKAITVTRVQSAARVAPAGCSTSAVVRLTDGVNAVNLTISAATNDSGAISQNYAAGSTLTVSILTAASGCTTSPGDLNVSIQSRTQ